jgi:hypothetical protein
MRSSLVTLAVAAMFCATAAFEAAPAKAAGGCCAPTQAPGTKLFEEDWTGAGAEPATPDAGPQPTPLDSGAEGLAVGSAYKDVYGALKGDNPCSRFFGGSRVAVTVLNEFSRRLSRKTLGARDVGLVMSGDYTLYHDMRTGASYRLFDNAVVNRAGPFAAVPTPSGARFRVGRFPAWSRKARALMLLHEMGHLVRGPDGWLLPNDGGDAALSDRNTRTVESRCLGQLLALGE